MPVGSRPGRRLDPNALVAAWASFAEAQRMDRAPDPQKAGPMGDRLAAWPASNPFLHHWGLLGRRIEDSAQEQDLSRSVVANDAKERVVRGDSEARLNRTG